MEDFLGEFVGWFKQQRRLLQSLASSNLTHYQQTDVKEVWEVLVLRIFQDSRKRIWVGTNGRD